MEEERASFLRMIIENAVPAEEFLAEQGTPENWAKIFSMHLAALAEEYDDSIGDEYLSSCEAKSIRALIAYTAYKNIISEQAVCAMVESHFNLSEIRILRSADYEDAVQYLVDFEPSKILN